MRSEAIDWQKIVKDFKFAPQIIISTIDDDKQVVKLYKFSPISQHMSIIVVKVIGNVIDISSRSASFAPSWVPLGFLISIILFWLPFYDFGCNARYCTEVLEFLASRDKAINMTKIKNEMKVAIDTTNEENDSAQNYRNLFFTFYIIGPVLFAASCVFFISPSNHFP